MTDRQRGFALLIVLWTLGFLALLGTQIVAGGRSETQLADNLRQDAVLEAAADGAVARVMFQAAGANDPQFKADGLVHRLSIGQVPVLVQIENETDRINLNTASGELLQSLVIEVGGAPSLANRLAASILDWRTSAGVARRDGAKAPEYRAAGRLYGPPGTPFQSVDELADVLGMTPELFARLAPHLTVFTDGDPDLSTHDPVVARVLADVAGAASDPTSISQAGDQLLRMHVTALGAGSARYSIVVVAAAAFQSAAPRVNILLRERASPGTNPMVATLAPPSTRGARE